jgi:uncharacterized membrane protein YcgQ (UPF0703/DUF1980 family)
MKAKTLLGDETFDSSTYEIEGYGVSDGFRISCDPQTTQEDQLLTDADRGKIEQERRKSATSRNQTFNVDSGSGGSEESAENVAPFKAVIKSPAERLTRNIQDNESEGEDS